MVSAWASACILLIDGVHVCIMRVRAGARKNTHIDVVSPHELLCFEVRDLSIEDIRLFTLLRVQSRF